MPKPKLTREEREQIETQLRGNYRCGQVGGVWSPILDILDLATREERQPIISKINWAWAADGLYLSIDFDAPGSSHEWLCGPSDEYKCLVRDEAEDIALEVLAGLGYRVIGIVREIDDEPYAEEPTYTPSCSYPDGYPWKFHETGWRYDRVPDGMTYEKDCKLIPGVLCASESDAVPAGAVLTRHGFVIELPKA